MEAVQCVLFEAEKEQSVVCVLSSPCRCPTSSRMGSSNTIMKHLFFSYSSSSMIFTFSSFLEKKKTKKKHKGREEG